MTDSGISSEQLPEGWIEPPLASFVRMTGGGTPLRSNPQFWGGDIPWLSSGDIKTERLSCGSEFITKEGFKNSSATMCPAGSLVVVVRSGILKHSLPVAILDQPAAINQDLRCLDTADASLNEWLALAIRAFEVQLLERNREGTTVQSVKSETLREWPVPLPPLAEQRRIVEKVEMLLARVQAARQRLDRVPLILKRFRQAILTAACNGELTADWRVEIGTLDTAPTDSEFVLREKSPANEEPPYELPNTWNWSTIGERFEVAIGGTPSRKIESYWNGDIPWVSSGEVAFTRITRTRETITREGLENSNTKLNPPGTVLIGMIGEGKTRGQAAILDIEACNNQNAAAIRVSKTSVPPEFVYCWLWSQYESTRGRGAGNSQPALNKERVKAIPFPFPPLAEQHEIVRRVEALFKLADAIERRVAAATARADKLTQAILAKAFRGELIPTEAELARAEGRDYETAEQLLARIKRGKATWIERGRVIHDLLLLLQTFGKPVSIHALEPSLVLMRNDAARETLLNGKATKAVRKKLAEPPQFIRGIDKLYRALEQNGTIRKVGASAYELAKPKLLKNTSQTDRAKAANVVRAVQTLKDLRNLPAVVAKVTNERYELAEAVH